MQLVFNVKQESSLNITISKEYDAMENEGIILFYSKLKKEPHSSPLTVCLIPNNTYIISTSFSDVSSNDTAPLLSLYYHSHLIEKLIIPISNYSNSYSSSLVHIPSILPLYSKLSNFQCTTFTLYFSFSEHRKPTSYSILQYPSFNLLFNDTIPVNQLNYEFTYCLISDDYILYILSDIGETWENSYITITLENGINILRESLERGQIEDFIPFYLNPFIQKGEQIWSYWNTITDPPPGWNTNGFDDTLWPKSFSTQFPSPEGSVQYYRTSITLSSSVYSSILALDLIFYIYSGIIVYLNNIEIFRFNMNVNDNHCYTYINNKNKNIYMEDINEYFDNTLSDSSSISSSSICVTKEYQYTHIVRTTIDLHNRNLWKQIESSTNLISVELHKYQSLPKYNDFDIIINPMGSTTKPTFLPIYTITSSSQPVLTTTLTSLLSTSLNTTYITSSSCVGLTIYLSSTQGQQYIVTQYTIILGHLNYIYPTSWTLEVFDSIHNNWKTIHSIYSYSIVEDQQSITFSFPNDLASDQYRIIFYKCESKQMLYDDNNNNNSNISDNNSNISNNNNNISNNNKNISDNNNNDDNNNIQATTLYTELTSIQFYYTYIPKDCEGIDDFSSSTNNNLSYKSCPFGYIGSYSRLCIGNHLEDTIKTNCILSPPYDLSIPNTYSTKTYMWISIPITIQGLYMNITITPSLPSTLTFSLEQQLLYGYIKDYSFTKYIFTFSNPAGMIQSTLSLVATELNCRADGIWPESHVNSTIQTSCTDDSFEGYIQRTCFLDDTNQSKWSSIISYCMPKKPSIAYSTSIYTFYLHVSISPLYPIFSHGLMATFFVTPSLPEGLSLNTTTGVISGIPNNLMASTPYLVHIKNAGGTDSILLRLQIVKAICNKEGEWVATIVGEIATAPCLESNQQGNRIRFCQDTNPPQWSSITDTCKPYTPVLLYPTYGIEGILKSPLKPLVPSFLSTSILPPQIKPELPAGITINNTYCIFGTPSVSLPLTTFYITIRLNDITTTIPITIVIKKNMCAADSPWNSISTGETQTIPCSNSELYTGYQSRDCLESPTPHWGNITVNCVPKPPTVFYPESSIISTVLSPLKPLIPIYTGAELSHYTIDPLPPSSLHFNISTGILTGTPQEEIHDIYTIQLINVRGDQTSFIISISISYIYCEKDNIWDKTQRGETIYLSCPLKQYGIQWRTCHSRGNEAYWGRIENSNCQETTFFELNQNENAVLFIKLILNNITRSQFEDPFTQYQFISLFDLFMNQLTFPLGSLYITNISPYQSIYTHSLLITLNLKTFQKTSETLLAALVQYINQNNNTFISICKENHYIYLQHLQSIELSSSSLVSSSNFSSISILIYCIIAVLLLAILIPCCISIYNQTTEKKNKNKNKNNNIIDICFCLPKKIHSYNHIHKDDIQNIEEENNHGNNNEHIHRNSIPHEDNRGNIVQMIPLQVIPDKEHIYPPF
ncbi:hypothetical protein WA158_008276 [Blastocystis sp. Blastoise]